MAVINIKQVHNNAVDTQNKKFDSPLGKLMNLKPVYTNYYKQSIDASTVGPGLENIKQPIGPESPLRFFEFKDMVLLGPIDPVNTENETDEIRGIRTKRDMSFLVLPDTIQPMESDFITFKFHNHNLLFRVNEVQNTLVKNRDFKKISCQLYDAAESGKIELLKKQVIENYSFIYDNYGGEYKCIVKSSYVPILDSLQYQLSRSQMIFNELFYNKYFGAVLFLEHDCPGNEIYSYSPDVVEYIKQSNSINYSDVNKLLVEHLMATDRKFKIRFANTPLFAMAKVGYLTEDKSFLIRIKELTDDDIRYTPFIKHYVDQYFNLLEIDDTVPEPKEDTNVQVSPCDTTSFTLMNYKEHMPLLYEIEYKEDVTIKTIDDFLTNLNEECIKDFFTLLVLPKYIRYLISTIYDKPLYKYDDIYVNKTDITGGI